MEDTEALSLPFVEIKITHARFPSRHCQCRLLVRRVGRGGCSRVPHTTLAFFAVVIITNGAKTRAFT